MTDIPARPMIRGEKVWLRGFEADDLAPYRRFVESSDAHWAGYRSPPSSDKVDEWHREVVQKTHGKDAFYFVVSPLGGNDFLGTTWLWNRSTRLGDGFEYSVFIGDTASWGTGIGTDAANATLDFAFGFTDTPKVWLATLKSNERAQRSFEKSGFRRDGMVRHYALMKGERVDAVLMSILREEWDGLDRRRSWEWEEA